MYSFFTVCIHAYICSFPLLDEVACFWSELNSLSNFIGREDMGNLNQIPFYTVFMMHIKPKYRDKTIPMDKHECSAFFYVHIWIFRKQICKAHAEHELD